jgi:hypothetical protein
LSEVMGELGRCQVRSGTDRPCRHLAVVMIRGIPFCESCASEQEVYFTIGELTEASNHPHDKRSLAGMLERIWWIRRRHLAGDQEEPCAA